MKENKLMSMVDFILEQDKRIELYQGTQMQNCINYAKFLKQPLSIEMFVPCKLVDGVWVVLDQFMEIKGRKLELKEYQQAKEKCLFEGFETLEHPYLPDNKSIAISEILHIFWHNEISGWKLSSGLSTIEDLVKYNLTLTKAI